MEQFLDAQVNIYFNDDAKILKKQLSSKKFQELIDRLVTKEGWQHISTRISNLGAHVRIKIKVKMN